MSALLKCGLMALGSACVLLLAGAFPLLGAPEVYRSGAMMLLGGVVGFLCLWAGWRLSAGVRARFIGGLMCTFFAAAGVGAVLMFGSQGVENACVGGPMWFGAVAMFCLAAVGLIFVCVFGYLAKRTMYHRLWLAAVHWTMVPILTGAFLDYFCEVAVPVVLVPGQAEISEVSVDGNPEPLGFKLKLEKFDESYYPGTAYSLYKWEEGKWCFIAKPERQGEELVLEERRWPVADLTVSDRMPRPYILFKDGEDIMLVLQDPPTVKEYRATCHVTTYHRGREEEREVDIMVNHPLSCNGWVIYLMDRRAMGDTVRVGFSARRAPGRLLVLGGMVGLIICTACWCWKRREDGEQEQQSIKAAS